MKISMRKVSPAALSSSEKKDERQQEEKKRKTKSTRKRNLLSSFAPFRSKTRGEVNDRLIHESSSDFSIASTTASSVTSSPNVSRRVSSSNPSSGRVTPQHQLKNILYDGESQSYEAMQVVVRIRPSNEMEKADNLQSCLRVDYRQQKQKLFASSSESLERTDSPVVLEIQTAPHSSDSPKSPRSLRKSPKLKFSPSPKSPRSLAKPSIHQFSNFDQVFDINSSQSPEFYGNQIAPMVENFLTQHSHNSLASHGRHHATTIFAYGKPDSGKSHTLLGPGKESPSGEFTGSGIIPQSIQQVFECLQNRQHNTIVKIQFLEIYGDELRDLLTTSTTPSSPTTLHHSTQQQQQQQQQERKRLYIRDNNRHFNASHDDEEKDDDADPCVVGATLQTVSNLQEALDCLDLGMKRRSKGPTAVKRSTCRSHVIFTVLLEEQHYQTVHVRIARTGVHQNHHQGKQDVAMTCRRSKLNFVDLAGSERLERTHTEGTHLKEGIAINQSLLALGNVLSALNANNDNPHRDVFVPYRDSKLTHLLKSSLGQCGREIHANKILFIACVSPTAKDAEETLDCLQFASRIKSIPNRRGHYSASDKTKNRGHHNDDKRSRIATFNALQGQVQALSSVLFRAIDDDKKSSSTFEHSNWNNCGNEMTSAVSGTLLTPKASSREGTPSPCNTLSHSNSALNLPDLTHQLVQNANPLSSMAHSSILAQQAVLQRQNGYGPHLMFEAKTENEAFQVKLSVIVKDGTTASVLQNLPLPLIRVESEQAARPLHKVTHFDHSSWLTLYLVVFKSRQLPGNCGLRSMHHAIVVCPCCSFHQLRRVEV